MKGKSLLIITFSLLLVLGFSGGIGGLWEARAEGPEAPGKARLLASPMGTAFTYQGRLVKDGNPVNDTCDLQFSLYDAASGGSQVGTTQTKTNVSVSEGLFIAQLDFGGSAFQGDARWLQIAVKCSGDGDYTTLSPRQALTAAPYALYATGAPWSGLTGVPAGFADGVDDTGADWSLTGNSGTSPGTNFLGTTDNVALELHVNNTRALRLQPRGNSPNLIGGHSGNSVIPGVYGATIGGGGESPYPNRVTDHLGTVGGGRNNQAGDNAGTTSDRSQATVGGGSWNEASGAYATVGGGFKNTASGDYATVGGGLNNEASGWSATVLGGRYASASHFGEMAYASGMFGVDGSGNAQTSIYVLRRTSSGTTLTELFLDGSGERITIPDGRTLTFDILVVARSSTGESAGYHIVGVIERVGYTTAVIGSVTLLEREDAPAWGVSVDADDTNEALRIRVLGGTGDSIRWVATVRTAEVAW